MLQVDLAETCTDLQRRSSELERCGRLILLELPVDGPVMAVKARSCQWGAPRQAECASESESSLQRAKSRSMQSESQTSSL